MGILGPSFKIGFEERKKSWDSPEEYDEEIGRRQRTKFKFFRKHFLKTYFKDFYEDREKKYKEDKEKIPIRNRRDWELHSKDIEKIDKQFDHDLTEKLVKDKTILDVGCGTGLITIELAKHGAKKVIGLDINRKFLEKAKERAKQNKLKNISFVQMDYYKQALKRGIKFDLLMSFSSLPLSKRNVGILKELSSYLKEGGDLILEQEVENEAHLKRILEDVKGAGYRVKDLYQTELISPDDAELWGTAATGLPFCVIVAEKPKRKEVKTKEEQEKERYPKIPEEPISPEILFEKFKSRDDVALIYLKGGELGGLNPEIKAEILNRLDKWFEIVEGEEHKLSFNEVATRWRKGYLHYPSLEVMRQNPKFNDAFLEKGRRYLAENNEKGFKEWISQAKEIAKGDVGLLRLEMLIAYFSLGGQNILLKLKEGIDRRQILKDLKIEDKEAEKMPFQEFVKRIVVGETTAYKAAPGTLREILANKMKEKKIFPCVDLWEKPKDKWALENKLNDPKLVASNLLNAIHAPGSLEELEIEFNLLTEKDLIKFNKAL